MKGRIHQMAEKISMFYDKFIGEMRERRCSELTAIKIWRGDYENFENFDDNDVYVSKLRKTAFVLKAATGSCFQNKYLTD